MGQEAGYAYLRRNRQRESYPDETGEGSRNSTVHDHVMCVREAETQRLSLIVVPILALNLIPLGIARIRDGQDS